MAGNVLSFAFLAVIACCTNAAKMLAAEMQHGVPAVLTQRDVQDLSDQSAPMTVTGVVLILGKMQGTIKKDMVEDNETHQELLAWCTKSKLSKGEAILNAKADVSKLSSEIEEGTAKSAGLKTAIAASKAEYESDKQSLAEMTALREKEVSDFEKTQLDLTRYIQQLGAAITTLSKHASAAFPQMPLSLLQTSNVDDDYEQWGMESSASRSLDAIMESNGLDDSAYSKPMPSMQQPRQRFLQSPGTPAPKMAPATLTYHENVPEQVVARPVWSAADLSTLQQAMHAASAFMQTKHEDAASLRSSDSEEILGILKQMKEEMEEDQAKAKEAESEAAASYEKLRKDKAEEIEGDYKEKEDQEDEKAKTDNTLADDKEELDNTQKTLSEDQAFLTSVNNKCDEEIAAYENRQASRADEVQAISEAVTILTKPFEDQEKEMKVRAIRAADKAAANNATANNTALFVQVSSQTHSHAKVRSKVMQLLRSAARRSDDEELAFVAASAQQDGLEMVGKEIDKMITQLKKNQLSEVREHDLCKEKLDSAVVDHRTLKEEIDANVKKTAEVAASLLEKGEKWRDAKTRIFNFQVDLNEAKTSRDHEKLIYQDVITDASLTLEVLLKAVYRLSRFYAKREQNSALDQTEARNDGVRSEASAPAPAPEAKTEQPPQTKEGYKPKAGYAVISLIEKLIGDTRKLIKNAAGEEAATVAAYVAMQKETEASIKTLSGAMRSLKAKEVSLKKTKNILEADHRSLTSQLRTTEAYRTSVTAECGSLITNFDATQQARQSEIEALQQTKQILSGASFD